MIEVSCGEYGFEFVDKMVTSVANGKCDSWTPALDSKMIGENRNEITETPPRSNMEQFEEEFDPAEFKTQTSNWEQFRILHKRMTIQMWRDSNYLKLRVYMHILLGLLIGSLFWDMGNDASKTLYNFGFCFTIMIFFMYIPMMPILLECEFAILFHILQRDFINSSLPFSSHASSVAEERTLQQVVPASALLFRDDCGQAANSTDAGCSVYYHGLQFDGTADRMASHRNVLLGQHSRLFDIGELWSARLL